MMLLQKARSAVIGVIIVCLALMVAACNGNTDPHDHIVTQWTNISATCEEGGEESGVCSICNQTITRHRDALGHDWQTITRVEPTCTTEGKEGVKCSRCNTEDIQTIPKKPHTMESMVKLIRPASCEQEGERIIRCSECKQEVQDTIPALGHNWITEDTLPNPAPTCTEKGKVEATCSRCKKKEEQEVDALGHDYESFYTIETAATFDHDGLKYRSCSRCNARTDETVIPKLDADTPTQYQLRVVRKNGDILKLAGISYEIFDSDEVSLGTGTFRNGVATIALKPASYTVRITSLPKGYSAKESYTVTWENLVADIELSSSLIMESPDEKTRYTLGSVVHNLSIKTISTNHHPNVEELVFSKLLTQYKAIVLNFWDTSCSFCEYEFPGLESAYKDYKDDIALIAIDDPDGMGDIETEEEVRSYADAKKRDLSCYIAMDNDGLAQMFNVGSYPTTVVIDREGAISYYHNGALVNPDDYDDLEYSTAQFKELFNKIVSEAK